MKIMLKGAAGALLLASLAATTMQAQALPIPNLTAAAPAASAAEQVVWRRYGRRGAHVGHRGPHIGSSAR